MKEIFKSWMDVEIIMEKCPILFLLRYIPSSSNYGVQIKKMMFVDPIPTTYDDSNFRSSTPLQHCFIDSSPCKRSNAEDI